MYHVCKLFIKIIGVYGQNYTVTIPRIPDELFKLPTQGNPILSEVKCTVTSATNQTTQNGTGVNLLGKDAGTVSCKATINGIEYSSESLNLLIEGIHNVFDINEVCLIVSSLW